MARQSQQRTKNICGVGSCDSVRGCANPPKAEHTCALPCHELQLLLAPAEELQRLVQSLVRVDVQKILLLVVIQMKMVRIAVFFRPLFSCASSKAAINFLA